VVCAGRLLLHKGGANTVLPTVIVYSSASRYEYGVSYGVYHSVTNNESTRLT